MNFNLGFSNISISSTGVILFEGAGKSFWLNKLLEELTENRPRPVFLGTDVIVDQMKLIGCAKYRNTNVEIEKFGPMAAELIVLLLKKVQCSTLKCFTGIRLRTYIEGAYPDFECQS